MPIIGGYAKTPLPSSVFDRREINFKTLRIDACIAGEFIIQRISTGEAYHVHLKPGVFPDDEDEVKGADDG